MRIPALLLLPVLFSSSIALAVSCDPVPARLRESNQHENRGWYENRVYGYGVSLPAGVTAYDEDFVTNHHGVGVPFGGPPESYIYLGGEYNSAEYRSARQRVSDELRWLRQDKMTVVSSAVTVSRLGGLPAVRLDVTYVCPGTTRRLVCVGYYALSSDRERSMLYEIELYALAASVRRDRPVLERMVKSWKYLGPSHHQ